MRSLVLRVLASLAMGLPAVMLLTGAAAPRRDAAIREPDKVVICSVSDVLGKTGPCGCHIPKGGLARIAGYTDSIRTEFGQMFLVDNGGFFPDDATRQAVVPFLMEAYELLMVDAVGVGDRDLRFGLGYLRENAASHQLPLVCANLVEKSTRRPAFAPYTIVEKGRVKVGFFGLISNEAGLGPSGDSLVAQDPTAAAKAMVDEMRKKGADVVVALSNLGKPESEDLCAAVDGIDVVIVGRRTPLIQKGRIIKNTLAVYGGEQGQNIARTIVTLDKRQKVVAKDADVFMLGPDVTDKPAMRQMVKEFEDDLRQKTVDEQK